MVTVCLTRIPSKFGQMTLVSGHQPKLYILRTYKLLDAYNYVVPGHLEKILYQDIGEAFGSEFPLTNDCFCLSILRFSLTTRCRSLD